MNVSVVIVSYQTPELLAQCLRSLQREAPEAQDIIVVDNASGDGTLDILRRDFPQVRCISSRVNVGFAKGVNWGLTNARAEHVLVLNPDIVLAPGSLQALVHELEQHPDVGLIAPKLVFPDGGLQHSCLRWQTPTIVAYRRTILGRTPFGKHSLQRYLMRDYDHAAPRDVDWVIGGAMLLRRQALDEVGGLDERFFLYFEDMDWCRRFWQAGWRVRYEPRAVMTHHHRRESARLPGVLGLANPLARIHIASSLKYFTKHLGNAGRLRQSQVTAVTHR